MVPFPQAPSISENLKRFRSAYDQLEPNPPRQKALHKELFFEAP